MPLFQFPRVQQQDNSGRPSESWTLTFFETDGTTLKTVYQDENLTIPHDQSSGIEADMAGRWPKIYITGAYKVTLKDEDGVPIYTDEASATTIEEAYYEEFSGTGAQTVFTLSEDLGTDPNTAIIYIDAGGTEGFDIVAPSEYSINGTTLTFYVAPAAGTDNIQVRAPSINLGAAATFAARAEDAKDITVAVEANVVSLYDLFDDRFLGAKSSNPTVDNDGDALVEGTIYWNTVSNVFRVYNGSAWENFTVSPGLLAAKDTVDIADLNSEAQAASKVLVTDGAGGFTYQDKSDPGSLAWWPKNTPPTGWLERDGSAISRTTYAALFAVIGTDYGVGDGSTTFNIPDDRGLFIRGWDNGRGFDSGRVFGSYQADDIKSHLHTASTNTTGSHTHDIKAANNAGGGTGIVESDPSGNYTHNESTEGGGSHSHTVTVNNTGGTENLVKNRAYLPIIKY
jgi:microcystin-dependent protein